MSKETLQEIDQKVKNNRVVVFMKGTPEAPMCGFSNQVCQVLRMVGAEFVGVDVIGNPEYRETVKEYTNWPTIPQIFIDGKFVGGCDIITELYESGELETMIKAK